jgi:methionyl-tRNA formyltransferase
MKKEYRIFITVNRLSLISIILLNYMVKKIKNNKNYCIENIIETSNENMINKKKNFSNKLRLFLMSFFSKNFKAFKEKIDNMNLLNVDDITNRYNINYLGIDKFKPQYNSKNILINCGGVKIFKKNFIKQFFLAINYHNAELPRFRGAQSNGYSLLFNDTYTFYSFHYINSFIDKGFVFYEKKIKINKNIYSLNYDLLKAKSAGKNILLILRIALDKKNKKNKSTKGGKYYSLKKFKNYFNNIEKFNFEYIKKFSRIFDGFYHKNYFVTKFKRHKNGIQINDYKIKITRINYLPTNLYKLILFFKKII